jgi:leucyl aminopeptidase
VDISGKNPASGLPLSLVTEAGFASWQSTLAASQQGWLRAQGYTAERGRVLAMPDRDGALAAAVVGLGSLSTADALSVWDAAALPDKLPGAQFRLVTPLARTAATLFSFGWQYGSYRHTRQMESRQRAPRAQLAEVIGADAAYVAAASDACALARDLINAPPNELGPQELAAAVAAVAAATGGTLRRVSGDELRAAYPLVSAVGQGSARAPLLLDVRWPRPGAPRVCIVGKGVCFDSGGLDLKPAAGMLLMKKDMGGAACALGLAQLLCVLQAPVDLRLIIPAVENSVGGNAFRPGDVWRSRLGLTVEIGNTDAEGRLVLADALADADSEQPDLLLDFATLTGAARTALGPELPPIYGTDRQLLSDWAAAGEVLQDPLWPMPLWAGYDELLSSRVADLNNVSSDAFAGSVVAALFLKRFVTRTPHWLHADIYAWNARDRPGRPVGAEPQALRASYALIRKRFG